MFSCARLPRVFLVSALLVYGQCGESFGLLRILFVKLICVFHGVFIPLVNLGAFKVLA